MSRVVRILRLPGRFYAGTMPAQVGMVCLDGGDGTVEGTTIVKVNEKSVVVRNQYGDWRQAQTVNITVTEARRFGWTGK